MKNLVYLGFILLISCVTAKQESDEDSASIPAKDSSLLNIEALPDTLDELSLKLLQVDEKVERIELRTMTSNAMTDELENEAFMDCKADRGCSLTGISHSEELIKLTTWFGFSNGYLEFHYYLFESKLIMVHEQRFTWPFDQEKGIFNYDSPEKNFDGKYYFEDEILFHMSTTGHNRFENDEIDPQTILLKEKEEYIIKINNSK